MSIVKVGQLKPVTGFPVQQTIATYAPEIRIYAFNSSDTEANGRGKTTLYTKIPHWPSQISRNGTSDNDKISKESTNHNLPVSSPLL